MSVLKRFRQQRHVLGSRADIVLVAADYESIEHVFHSVWHTITEFDIRFSRFRPDSEISQFNEKAGQWVGISADFTELLIVCKKYAHKTEGLFNPFVLPALQAAGYRGSWPHVEQADPLLDVRSRHMVSSNEIEITEVSARIPEETAIDIGGIGKGYMLDTLAALLERMNVSRYYISLGGDIICHGFDADYNPWRIGISAARQRGARVGLISNNIGEVLAIASSSVVRRSGSGWHHIIDPRTGKPTSTSILMATVVASSGTAADIFAKTCIIDPEAHCLKDQIDSSIKAICLQLKDTSVTVPFGSNLIVIS